MNWEALELTSGSCYYRGPKEWRRACMAALKSGPLGLFRSVYDLKSHELIGVANPVRSLHNAQGALIPPEQILAMMCEESRSEHAEVLDRARRLDDGDVLRCRLVYELPDVGRMWLNHTTRVLMRDPDGSARLIVTDCVPDGVDPVSATCDHHGRASKTPGWFWRAACCF